MNPQRTKYLSYEHCFSNENYKIDLITPEDAINNNSKRIIPVDLYYQKIEESIPKLVEVYDAFRKDPLNSRNKYECYELENSLDALKLNVVVVSRSAGLNLVYELCNEGALKDNHINAKIQTVIIKDNFRKKFHSEFKEVTAHNKKYNLIFSPYLVYSYDAYVYYEALNLVKSQEFIDSIDGIDGTYLFRGDNIFLLVTIEGDNVIIDEIKALTTRKAAVVRID